jgi:hypothetical protein
VVCEVSSLCVPLTINANKIRCVCDMMPLFAHLCGNNKLGSKLASHAAQMLETTFCQLRAKKSWNEMRHSAFVYSLPGDTNRTVSPIQEMQTGPTVYAFYRLKIYQDSRLCILITGEEALEQSLSDRTLQLMTSSTKLYGFVVISMLAYSDNIRPRAVSTDKAASRANK